MWPSFPLTRSGRRAAVSSRDIVGDSALPAFHNSGPRMRSSAEEQLCQSDGALLIRPREGRLTLRNSCCLSSAGCRHPWLRRVSGGEVLGSSRHGAVL
ncbi:hypothetical protein SKAU_G00265680 [Synaphobranchus kaupii]|uniref:Uncharacterized protein n=1 Tax=Synaphobranchus kaupii TaxID=118154 RepID=A0A9Q1EZ65_SYNKA|nr:hypothetical protein SKAU_G00265680 [Synaphobranchus kaupii]